MWVRGSFTVPMDISEERVLDALPRSITKFWDFWEKDGWRLISRPRFDPIPRLENDRKRYVIWLNMDRKPVTQIVEVDMDNPKLVNELIRRYDGRILG